MGAFTSEGLIATEYIQGMKKAKGSDFETLKYNYITDVNSALLQCQYNQLAQETDENIQSFNHIQHPRVDECALRCTNASYTDLSCRALIRNQIIIRESVRQDWESCIFRGR